MPLARIVTACVTEAVPLARRLREQGYSVEIVSPGTLVATPADVEFTLELHPAAAALERAAEFLSAHDADVHVAPGTLAAERPMPKAPAAPAREVMRPTPATPPATPSTPQPHPLHEAWVQSQTALRDAWTNARAQFAAASRQTAERVRALQGPAHTAAQCVAQAGANSGKHAAAGATHLARRMRDWQERTRAKAAPRAAALSAAAKQNAAATAKAEWQRVGRFAAAGGRFLGMIPAAVAAFAQRTAVAKPKLHAPRAFSGRRREWNYALAGAAVASLVLTLGWAAYTNRRPAADLLPRTANGSTPTEGAGTTLVPSAAPVVQVPVAQTAPPPRSSSPRQQPAFSRPESDEVAEDTVVYHGAPREKSGAQEEKDGEVTVRHYPRKTREQAATPSPPGVKKISDLD